MPFVFDHIGIAVKNINSKLPYYTEFLQLKPGERVAYSEYQMISQMLMGEGFKVELMEPLTPDGLIGRFIAAKGEGIHHVAFKCADVGQNFREACDCGFKLIHNNPPQEVTGILFIPELPAEF